MKNLKIALLCDIYGILLTERQKDIVDRYYNLDNSLGEIAESLGISRQSVKDSLVLSETALENYEGKLKIFEKKTTLKDLILQLENSQLNKEECLRELLQLFEED